MKHKFTDLYNSRELGQVVTTYSEEHSTTLPQRITDYHAANIDRPDANYLTSNFQSQFHVFLARLMGAKRVLEIGVFLGYSAMVWSHAVGPDGHVTGLEFDADYAEQARKGLAENGFNNVEIIVGPAAETLPTLSPTTPYDLVFIDADKAGYLGYVKQLLAASPPGASSSSSRLLRSGALVLADNVLRRGWVASDAIIPGDVEAKRKELVLDEVRAFNDYVAGEPRLEAFMVPLWDGVTAIRLVD